MLPSSVIEKLKKFKFLFWKLLWWTQG